jgi:hypothetical protein
MKRNLFGFFGIFLIFTFFAASLLLLNRHTPAEAQEDNSVKREIDTSDISVPEGYAVEAYLANLSLPTSAIFAGDDMIVAESGYNNASSPRVLKISPDGTVEIIAEEGLEPPVTGLLEVDDRIFVSHMGKVSIINENGSLEDIVTDLPSDGDHQTTN